MAANENMISRYRLDAARSRFVVQAFAEGLLSFVGHDPIIAVCGFGGDARFVPGTLEQASLLVMVQADSLAVVGDTKEKDRRDIESAMRGDVLETARHPEIVFMSRSVSAGAAADGQYRVSIVGNLSLHGVTRSQRIDARVTVDGDSLRAQGEFPLRQSDYQIRPYSAVGGTLKVKDEVKVSFDIFASKS
jgi:polyisoprenoid-binding protein YceI